MEPDNIFQSSKPAQLGLDSVYRVAPQHEEHHGILGAISDAWSYASHHKLEFAAGAVLATAAVAIFKPLQFLPAVLGRASEPVSEKFAVQMAEDMSLAAKPAAKYGLPSLSFEGVLENSSSLMKVPKILQKGLGDHTKS